VSPYKTLGYIGDWMSSHTEKHLARENSSRRKSFMATKKKAAKKKKKH
jgi:hypothetical protein